MTSVPWGIRLVSRVMAPDAVWHEGLDLCGRTRRSRTARHGDSPTAMTGTAVLPRLRGYWEWCMPGMGIVSTGPCGCAPRIVLTAKQAAQGGQLKLGQNRRLRYGLC
jgi:hypothetical protein